MLFLIKELIIDDKYSLEWNVFADGILIIIFSIIKLFGDASNIAELFFGPEVATS